MTMKRNYTTTTLSHFRWWKRTMFLWVGKWRNFEQSLQTRLTLIELVCISCYLFSTLESLVFNFSCFVDWSWRAINLGGPYGGTSATNNNEASGLPVGQNAYEDGYAAAQVCDDPMCYVVLSSLRECSIIVHCLIFINLLIPEVSSITINVWIILFVLTYLVVIFIKSIQLNMYLCVDYKLMIRTICIWSIVN